MLMMAMLVAIVGVGLLSASLVPTEVTKSKRGQEEQLKSALAQIRFAFDLKRLHDPNYNPPLKTAAQVASVLKTLADGKFLRNASMTDPTVVSHLWSGSSEFYWQGNSNYSYNTSFESAVPPDTSKMEVVASWSTDPSVTEAASDTKFFPSQGETAFDDYSGQNKLGKRLLLSGTSLRLTR